MIRLLLVILASLVVCAGSCSKANVRPDPPLACTLPAPEVERVETVRYVRVPEKYREHFQKPASAGQLPLTVAELRGNVIDACNVRLDDIGAIEGTEVTVAK